jgi:phosphonate ABC transporter permease subunit PhnE
MKRKNRGPRYRLVRNILLMVFGFLLYAYAVQATEVNLRRPLEPQRQENLINMMRELARPELFAYETETRSVHLTLRTPCPEQPLATQRPSEGRLMTLNPNCATTPQDRLTLTGEGFPAFARGSLRWHPPGEEATPRQLTIFRADANGNFTAQFSLPDVRISDEPQTIEMRELVGQNIVGLSSASIVTWERILETIFMALMASTIGTLIAVPVSFMAARNLMETVKGSLASIMAAIIAIPVGVLVGGLVASLLNTATLQIVAQTTVLGVGSFVAGAGLIGSLIYFGPSLLDSRPQSTGQQVFTQARLLAVVLLVLFNLMLLAYLGLPAGDWLRDNLGFFGFLGNLVYVLSDFTQLMFPSLVGLAAILTAISLGGRYGDEAIRRLEKQEVAAKLLTLLLAFAGTAVIVYGIGSGLNWLYQFENVANWTIWPALILGGVVALLSLAVPTQKQLPLGMTIYFFIRGILNTLRSIEPIILAVIFVIWVGLGPFAGIMALTVHSIADLGKLFSEEVENIAGGPIEAVTATGASKMQTIVYAVVPQIIPPYLSFIFYRWDINVRMSTIIGFVGGGGIGFVLQTNVNLLLYRRASVMIIAIALVVSLLDYVSARLRNRLI